MKSFLFKEHMFNATIAGDKTQTRRIVRTRNDHDHLEFDFINGGIAYFYDLQNGDAEEVRSPKQTGDICYLKEPYYLNDGKYKDIPPMYAFDWPLEGRKLKYKNKLFMPEKYARYFIKITNIRVEQIQLISRKDAIAEGIELAYNAAIVTDDTFTATRLYRSYAKKNSHYTFTNPIESFQTLWESINKKEPNRWEDNPFVWVYEYEMIEKAKVYGPTGKQLMTKAFSHHKKLGNAK